MARQRHRSGHSELPEYVPPFDANLLAEPVSALSPSEDLTAKLEKGGVRTLLDVTKRTERDFFRIPTFNKKNLLELKRITETKGLFLRPMPPKEGEGNEREKQSASGAGSDRPERMQKGKNAGRGGKIDGKVGENNRQGEENARGGKNGKRGGEQNLQQRGASKTGAHQQQQGNGKGGKQQRPEKGKGGRIWEPDGVSEAATKAERERKRPRRQVINPPADPYVKINRAGKWGFQDRAGKEVVAPSYDEVFSYKEDLCCVERDGLFGFIDRQGEVVIPIEYECASSFSEGVACVFKNGHCGYIDKENETVVDFRFDAGTAMKNGNCRVKRDGKWGELWRESPTEIRWIN